VILHTYDSFTDPDMELIFRELRQAIRMLQHAPGFAVAVVLTLALGIGVNTSVFSVVNAVLLRPLPYEDPGGLLQIKKSYPAEGARPAITSEWVSYEEVKAWQNDSHMLAWIAAQERGQANLTGGDMPVRVNCAKVSASLFPNLGAKTSAGRLFSQADDKADSEPVVILSYSFWRKHFNGNDNVIGRIVSLDAQSFHVIGVLDSSFQTPFPEPVDVWVPIERLENYGWMDRRGVVHAIAHLKPGASLAQAQSELDAIFQATRRPGRKAGVVLAGFHEESVRGVRTALWIFLGAVGCVLLIACANVANLLLARAVVREREIAVRAALGASRFQVIRQLFTESMVLAVLGGLLGLLLSLWGRDLLQAAVQVHIPIAQDIGMDWRVLCFMALITILTGLIFGLAPALYASRVRLIESLKEGGRNHSGSLYPKKLGSGLIVAETALALMLLAGAGLLIKSYLVMTQVDLGFQPDRVLAFSVHLTRSGYPDAPSQSAFFDRVSQRIETLPGVDSLGISAAPPLGFTEVGGRVLIQGRTARGEEPMVSIEMVNADYFRTLKIPLLMGRTFTKEDRAGARPVAVVNEEFVAQYFPQQNPIGQIIRDDDPAAEWMEIVGVASNVRRFGQDREVRAQLYKPFRQSGSPFMTLLIRTSAKNQMKAATMLSAVRSQVELVDKEQPVFNFIALDQSLEARQMPRRVNMLILSSFALLALLLAAVGIYGVVSYSVSQRTHEIGIRIALGAQARAVRRVVIRQAMTAVTIGMAFGLAMTFTLGRVLSSLLFQVKAHDPAVMVMIAAFLWGVAFLASFVPARRVTCVDPVVALRHY
jgi:putative ABC transport system permease protein